MFAKVFASIFDSTVNEQPPHVFKVWIALLAFAQDEDGIVDMTVRAIANRVELPIEQVDDAIRILSSPDPSSRCTDHEGRRIVPIPDRAYGWQIVTFAHYRALKRAEDRKEYMRAYMRERRAVQNGATDAVNSRKQPLVRLADTETETESHKEKKENARDLVESFVLEPTHREWAASNVASVDVDREIEAWRDYLRSNGYRAGRTPVKDARASF